MVSRLPHSGTKREHQTEERTRGEEALLLSVAGRVINYQGS